MLISYGLTLALSQACSSVWAEKSNPESNACFGEQYVLTRWSVDRKTFTDSPSRNAATFSIGKGRGLHNPQRVVRCCQRFRRFLICTRAVNAALRVGKGAQYAKANPNN